jgi:sulfotransferase
VATGFTITDASDLAADPALIDAGGADAQANTAYTFNFQLGAGVTTLTLAAQLDAINLDAGSSLAIDGNGNTLSGGNRYNGASIGGIGGGGLFANYYHVIHPERTVVDTNRLWCAHLSSLAALFPRARVIACVRHVPWIIDSVESLIRRNVWQPSKIFEADNGGTMWQRVDGMAGPAGLVGFAWNALRQAFFSNEADRMLVLTYRTLTTEPARAMAEVYRFLGLRPFRHDFENVTFDETEFDARLGTPGLHSVGRCVLSVERQTILAPDLWARFENDDFWWPPAPNPQGVIVV